MDAGAESALTLVSAPAGFGKTTVLACWLTRASAEARAVAFVSLDESDSHANSFWLYVVTALQSAVPGVGAGVLPLLAAGQPPTLTMLTAILNDVGAQPAEVDVILDDYHLADGAEVAEGMTFLLEHQPANLHVVVSTRADPNLPLARLRARGELVEIRVRDLRFTPSETAAYLADVGGLDLASPDVATLESRTEGWAAALQLASLSMQGRDDIGVFVAGFAGTDRYVVDYLADEVLSRQTDEVRDFLERTSVLRLLNGSLCDAVLEHSGSQVMLERLERANLFLVALDSHRTWYRYHHLFADVLHSRLRSEHPGIIAKLHLRASHWYEEVGDPVAAVRHSLAAGAVDRAADLIETAIPELRRTRQEITLRRWIDDIPDDIVQRHPVLAIGFVGALMSSNEFSDVARRLRLIEDRLPAIHARIKQGGDSSASDDQVVALDLKEMARIPAAVELYWAGLALVSGDLAATHHHADRAIELATPTDDVVPAGAAGLSGLAYWAVGELDAAQERYLACIEGLRRADHLSDAIGCCLTVAEIQMAQGRLRDAEATLDTAARMVNDMQDPTPRGTADIHVGYAQLALTRGDVETARAQLTVAASLGEECGLPQYAYRSRVVAAMLSESQGNLTAALDLVQQAQQVYLGDFSPNVRPLHAMAARIRIHMGDLDAVWRWAEDHDVTASGELTYLREFEHMTLAEALIAGRRDLPDADLLLERLLDAATAGGRGATVTEVFVLQERAAVARGDAPPAGANGLPESLSPREFEVLQLLATELDGPEIAQHLFVSLNTLRTHTKSIYTKLGVNSRRAAVRRGAELGLIRGR